MDLSEQNRKQPCIPAGFADGSCGLGDVAEFVSRCSDDDVPADERTILGNDPVLRLAWPVSDPPVSEKDRHGVPLGEAELIDGR